MSPQKCEQVTFDAGCLLKTPFNGSGYFRSGVGPWRHIADIRPVHTGLYRGFDGHDDRLLSIEVLFPLWPTVPHDCGEGGVELFSSTHSWNSGANHCPAVPIPTQCRIGGTTSQGYPRRANARRGRF